MPRRLFAMRRFIVAVLISFICLHSINAQERKGSITGHATDINNDPLVGARVTLDPLGNTTATDAQGQFTISDVLPNKYTLTISYAVFCLKTNIMMILCSG